MAKNRNKKDRERSAFIAKIITIVISTLILLFLMGHLSVILNGGEVGFAEALSLMPEHIKTEPLNFMSVNPYVAYFGGLGYILFFIVSISKQTMPQAEMKGIEHGSSDFQTADERMDFLADNTSDILPLDTAVVSAWAKKRRIELGLEKPEKAEEVIEEKTDESRAEEKPTTKKLDEKTVEENSDEERSVTEAVKEKKEEEVKESEEVAELPVVETTDEATSEAELTTEELTEKSVCTVVEENADSADEIDTPEEIDEFFEEEPPELEEPDWVEEMEESEEVDSVPNTEEVESADAEPIAEKNVDVGPIEKEESTCSAEEAEAVDNTEASDELTEEPPEPALPDCAEEADEFEDVFE